MNKLLLISALTTSLSACRSEQAAFMFRPPPVIIAPALVPRSIPSDSVTTTNRATLKQTRRMTLRGSIAPRIHPQTRPINQRVVLAVSPLRKQSSEAAAMKARPTDLSPGQRRGLWIAGSGAVGVILFWIVFKLVLVSGTASLGAVLLWLLLGAILLGVLVSGLTTLLVSTLSK